MEFSPEELETTPCPGCGAGDRRAVVDAPVVDAGSALCRVVECVACGLLYLTPRPHGAALARCYPDDYDCHAAVDDRERAKRQRRLAWERDALAAFYGYPPGPNGWNRLSGTLLYRLVDERRRADWIAVGIDTSFARETGARVGRALEFGCGAGDYLERLLGWGWEAEGLDASPNAVRVAAERTGARVHLGSLPHADLAPQSFDLVVMRQALEHTPGPRAVAEAAYELLRPGGRIVVSVPNADGFGRRTFGRDWLGWDLPRHLVHFTPAALTSLMRRIGFEVLAVHTLPEPGWLAASARAASASPTATIEQRRLGSPWRARWIARRELRRQQGEAIYVCGRRPGNAC